MRQPGLLLVGLCAWAVTVAFGGVLLDVVCGGQQSNNDAEGALGVRLGPWVRLGEGGLAGSSL